MLQLCNSNTLTNGKVCESIHTQWGQEDETKKEVRFALEYERCADGQLVLEDSR